MRRILIMSLLGCIVMSCQKKDDLLTRFTQSERDSLLTDIITYIYSPPSKATPQTRFNTRYRKYYVAQISKFKLEMYSVNKEGVHFYYIIRPARSAEGAIRGAGGLFRKDKNGKIKSFKEVFNTPVLALAELRQRGNEMFQWMVKYEHVNEYLKNPDYVEWPDKYTQYDTVRNEWIPIN